MSRIESVIPMKPQPDSLTEGCGLCGSTSARELYTARDRFGNSDESFAIVQCNGCGVLRTLPKLSEAELAIFYPDDYWGGPDPSRKWISSSQYEKTRFLARCGLSNGSILDVGCGAGFFLRALDSKKWDRFGVETSAAAAKATEAAIGSGHVFTGTLTASSWEAAQFDVITFWSALEHTNEPRINLSEARRIVKPGGTLIVQLPNAASYQARLFGGDWFALDAPRHRYHFTLPVLERLLSEIGFEVYRTTYFSKAHNSHALKHSLKTRLVTKSSSAINHGLFYLSVPFVKPFDIAMSAFGKGATLTLAARAV
jgi:2-polyprenyl-3-methyl-5-hydroxy-6-metoxy-1,4-benzoquinol methylase